MLKKIVILLLCTNIYASEQSENSNLPTFKTVIIAGAVCAGVTGLGIVAAPYVLPAGTLLAIKAALAAVSTKAAAAMGAIKIGAIGAVPVVQSLNAGLFVARLIRPYVLPTNEENRDQLLQKRAAQASQAKNELSSCLIKNKAWVQGDTLYMPTVCEEAAIKFEMLVGQGEFAKTIRELNLPNLS